MGGRARDQSSGARQGAATAKAEGEKQDMIKGVCPKDPASAPVGLKKAELAALAERKLKGKGWLPALLRTPI